jgi:MFS family permease
VGGPIFKWYIPRVNKPRLSLGRNVIALAVVSLFTDVSSEMIYPLLPVFLTATLGASASTLGVIEGAAETTASLLKLASGWWSDRVRRRKPLVVFGYALASLVRPLIAAAQSATQVLVIRLTDRIGKGIRNSPRDALIAESVDPSIRGRAFGFHRAGDNAGGVVGPLIAFALLQWWALDLRTVFWLALIPGILATITVIVFVRETQASSVTPPPAPSAAENGPVAQRATAEDSTLGTVVGQDTTVAAKTNLPKAYWAYLGVLLLFSLGNSTDAFLLLRARQLDVSLALIPIIWATLNVVRTLASTHAGALSDRIGRVPTVIAGWAIYALVYFGFAFASLQWHAWALFAAYGLFFALTEGAERALVADFVPAARRGTAFGWYYLVVGLATLPASILFGVVWDRLGSHAAFIMGAVLATLAAVGIALIPKPVRAT